MGFGRLSIAGNSRLCVVAKTTVNKENHEDDEEIVCCHASIQLDHANTCNRCRRAPSGWPRTGRQGSKTREVNAIHTFELRSRNCKKPSVNLKLRLMISADTGWKRSRPSTTRLSNCIKLWNTTRSRLPGCWAVAATSRPLFQHSLSWRPVMGR